MALDPNDVLTKEYIATCFATKEGREELFDFLLAQRIAGGLAVMFAELGIPIPNPDDQMKACGILFLWIRRKPVEEVLEELQMAHALLAQGIRGVSDELFSELPTQGDA